MTLTMTEIVIFILVGFFWRETQEFIHRRFARKPDPSQLDLPFEERPGNVRSQGKASDAPER